MNIKKLKVIFRTATPYHYGVQEFMNHRDLKQVS